MGTTVLSKLIEVSSEMAKDTMKVINAITDEMSFMENDKFILSDTSVGEAIGEGVVSGFARIDDIQVSIFATNPLVLKGSIGKQNSAKIVKSVNAAISTSSPLIAIIDTAGARIFEGIEAMEGYGTIIKAFSEAYGQVPTICVIKGNNYGLSAYLSGICDICIAYDKASLATSSPLILAANTKIDTAKVGTVGIHTTQSGIIGAVVKNDKELKTAVSGYLSYICNPIADSSDDGNRVAKALKDGAKVKDIILEATDKGSFYEIKKDFATEVTIGFARLDGISVGIVGVNGKLTANGAVKISDFLTTCEAFGVSIVNIVDCDGAENNLTNENTVLIREVSNLLYAFNQLSVAKISLVTGKAIGLGYTAFAAKSIVDYSLAWANASINVISDSAAASLLYSTEIAAAKDKEKATVKLATEYGEENSSAVCVAKKGYIDNVIEPALTRQYLIAAVQMYLSKR